MTDAIGIGFFQFDNLVRNRVPFALFMMSVSLEDVYGGAELEHINRYGIEVEPTYSGEMATQELNKKRFRPIDPVLVLCSDGQMSKRLADDMGSRGYLNCYYVEGGFAQLQRSARE